MNSWDSLADGRYDSRLPMMGLGDVAGADLDTNPKGTVFHIDEWYGWNGTPNEGMKMLAVKIAKKALELVPRRRANLTYWAST